MLEDVPHSGSRHVEVAAIETLRCFENASVRSIEDRVQLPWIEGHAVVGLAHRHDQHLPAPAVAVTEGRVDALGGLDA